MGLTNEQSIDLSDLALYLSQSSECSYLEGKQAILAYFRATWPQVTPQQAIFTHVIIHVAEDAQTATCTLRAVLVEGSAANANAPRRTEEFEVMMDWVKHDGEWQAARIIAALPEAQPAEPQ